MEKIALVTGAGRGIGAATARLLGREGYDVCVNYLRDRAAAEEVVRDVRACGRRAIAVAADVGREEDILALFFKVDQELGRLDALVNNAGILETQMRVADMSAQRIERVLTTNVLGPFLCAREAVRRMSTELGGTGGAIVNVSSRAAVLGSAGEYVDYAASKGALDTLTIGLASEVAGEGIRVNTVRPGFIYTDIHADGGEPGRVDRVKSSLPLGRGGDPEEVARAIYWLLSDASSYSTGTFIDVAGGR